MSPADIKLSLDILNGFLWRCLDGEIIREIKISWAFQVSSSLATPVAWLGKEVFPPVDINGHVEKLRLASCGKITYSVTPTNCTWTINDLQFTQHVLFKGWMKETPELDRKITAFCKFNPYCEILMKKVKRYWFIIKIKDSRCRISSPKFSKITLEPFLVGDRQRGSIF